MEYSFKDVLTWTFTHPDVKSAIENFIYLSYSQLGEPYQTSSTEYVKAVEILQQIAAIGNPIVCSGMFADAANLFRKASKNLKDEPKLLSHIGHMFCNHWMGQDYLNPQIQQEISMMKYRGSFWHRYGDAFISLGSAAVAGIGMLCGAPTGVAVGSAGQGARGLLDDHSEGCSANEKHFNNLRNTVLSLRFSQSS